MDTHDCETPINKEETDELQKVLKDFVKDLKITFPELEINEDIRNILLYDSPDSRFVESMAVIKSYLVKVLPERFFDIIYENTDLFEDNEKNTSFLPNIEFKELWKKNITENTRKSIWKYLQLLLFSVVSELKDKEGFGDTENLFKAIDSDDFKTKIKETMDGIQDMFNSTDDISSNMNSFSETMKDGSFNLPDTETFHKHIEEMMGGKIGLLAKEIAEETTKELGLSTEGDDMEKMMKNLMKDPSSMMKLVKSVGEKLETKLSKGDIKESELISEATDMMKNLKNMPGMANMEEMMKKMGLDMSKLNKGAMQSEMAKNMKKAKQKEKLRDELKRRQDEKEKLPKEDLEALEKKAEESANELIESVYKVGDGAERTKKNKTDNPKKKKGKKKK